MEGLDRDGSVLKSDAGEIILVTAMMRGKVTELKAVREEQAEAEALFGSLKAIYLDKK